MLKDFEEFFDETEDVEEVIEDLDAMDEDQQKKAKREKKIKSQNAGTRGKAWGICAIFLTGYAALIGGILYYKHEAKTVKQQEAVETVGTAISTEITYTRQQVDEEVRLAVEKAISEYKPQVSQENQDVLDTIREGLSGGDSVLETLRPLYPDQVVLYTGGAYRFFPIIENLRKNTYNQENFVTLESGEKQYVVDGETVSFRGIDVSKHQGEISWDKVAKDNIDFALVRVGVRGYGTGKLVEDEQYEANLKGAINNGIKVGVYFFSQAITREEAIEEAQFVVERIKPYKVDGPVVFDVEKVADSSARMNSLSVDERTEVTLAFLEEIEKSGYRGMIYFNTETSIALLDMSKLEKYEKWFAYYGSEIYYPYDFGIWQYSDKGSVAGIKGAVDLNIAMRIWE